jgi:LysM repeat protein
LAKNQYQVRPGDTMSGIAVSRGVPLRRLLALNPQVSDPNRIVPGEIINL